MTVPPRSSHWALRALVEWAFVGGLLLRASAASAQEVPTPAPAYPSPSAPSPVAPDAASSSPTADSATPAPSAGAPAASPAPSAPPAKPSKWDQATAQDRMTESMRADDSEKVSVNLQGAKGDEFYAWVGNGRATSSSETELLNGQVYERLCSAPCTAKLPLGHNRIAVASGGSPVVANHDVTIYGPSTLTAHYSSYGAQRVLGTLVLVGGAAAGVALVFTAPACKEDPNDPNNPGHCSYTQQILGVGAGVAGVVVGSLLLLKSDEVEVSLAPGAPGSGAPTPATGPAASLDRLRAGLSGLSLSGRF